MKSLFISVILLFPFLAQASIIANSDLDLNQQAIVVQAINDQCGHTFGIEQTAPTIIRYDYQEIGDIFYTIQLTGIQSLDQGVLDTYDITVQAVIPAVHSAPPQFLVEKDQVTCVLR